MKYQLTLLVIFFITNIFSQTKRDFLGQITYTQIINFGIEIKEEYNLYFTKDWSFSEETDVTEKETYKTTIQEKNGVSNVYVSGRKNKTTKYYYNTNKDFYFRDNFENEIFLVKEVSKFPKWELINETKNIGGFICKKAKVDFRGRTYFAWYSEKIALPFGPWKARGLPGIILEFYEKNYVFYIRTTKILIDNKKNINIKLPSKEIKNTIDIENYFSKKQEIKNRYFQKLSSKMPKGSKPLKIDDNCEDCDKQILEIFTNDK